MKLKTSVLAPLFTMLGCLSMQGCESVTMRAPVASERNVASLRAAGLGPVSLGQFDLDHHNVGKDGHFELRGSAVKSPYQGSFADYLREIIKTHLAAAGVYRLNSDTVLSAMLTESHLNAGAQTGSGSLKGKFIVKSKGAVVYEREIGYDETWESSPFTQQAVPWAIDRYENMYQKIVLELFNDPQFRKAVSDR